MSEVPKYDVLPPKVRKSRFPVAKHIFQNYFEMGPLDPKKTALYRGQTVKPQPELRGGDFQSKFEKNTLLRRFSGKFWSQSIESAQSHAKIVGESKKPVAVFKAETNKVDALKGVKGIIQHNRMTGDLSYNKKEYREKISRSADRIRQNTLYETIQEPKNKRLSLRGTASVNPTFKGVRLEALRAAAQVLPRVATRLFGPTAVVDFILNPPPLDGGPGYATGDPRKRRKQTIARIK